MTENTLQTTNKTMESVPQRSEFSAFGNIIHFENAQRMAKALCSSAMVPETYRGETNIGSCLIALEMSNRIGANVLSVMQNLYIVHGKPAWSSQFLIACVNASGRFSPLRYTMTGEKGSDTMGCIAWATDKANERLESPEITIGIAKAEGWFQKNGSKWKTMPELMLRYRTATLFARLYAPELTMGIHTEDEVIDVVEVAPVVTSPVFVPKMLEAVPAKNKEPQMAKFTPPALKIDPKPERAAVDVEAAPATDLSFEQVVDGESKEMMELKVAMAKHDVSETSLLKFADVKGLLKDNAKNEPLDGLGLSDIRADKLVPLTKNILANGATLKQIKEGGIVTDADFQSKLKAQ